MFNREIAAKRKLLVVLTIGLLVASVRWCLGYGSHPLETEPVTELRKLDGILAEVTIDDKHRIDPLLGSASSTLTTNLATPIWNNSRR